MREIKVRTRDRRSATGSKLIRFPLFANPAKYTLCVFAGERDKVKV